MIWQWYLLKTYTSQKYNLFTSWTENCFILKEHFICIALLKILGLCNISFGIVIHEDYDTSILIGIIYMYLTTPLFKKKTLFPRVVKNVQSWCKNETTFFHDVIKNLDHFRRWKRGRESMIHTFPKGISAKWNAITTSRIWTRGDESISQDFNHYTTRFLQNTLKKFKLTNITSPNWQETLE